MAYRRTPRVQARLDAQRETILAGAAAQLADRGYAGCSVASVAARAGVASGTVYQHFDSKADLVAELFRRVVTREVAAVRSAAESDGPAPERVAAFVEIFAGRALKAPRLAYALLAEPVDPAVDALRLEYRRAFRDVIAEVVADGVTTGAVPPQDATVVASALIGAIAEALVGPLATGHDEPSTIPTLITFALRSLGVPDAAHA